MTIDQPPDQPSNPSPVDRLLVSAASDVRHIISYLAKNAKNADDGDVKTALAFVEKLHGGAPLTADEEMQFWKAYTNLVKQALPARVEALYYGESVGSSASENSDNPQRQQIGKQEEALRKIRRISIGAFAMALIMLAYLSIAETAMQRNATLEEEYFKLQSGIMKGTRLESVAGAPIVRIVDDSSGGGESTRSQTPGGSAGGAGTEKPPASASTSIPVADANLTAMITAAKTQIRNLISFNNTTLRFLQLRRTPAANGGGSVLSPVDATVLATQQFINSLVSKYFLAVVAALLGVTVFILRSANADLQALSFRWMDSGSYSNRLTLGVVGGIAISWFAVRDTTGIVGSISPAALAFLVGYSVEVLYNILDSLVKALGGGEKK